MALKAKPSALYSSSSSCAFAALRQSLQTRADRQYRLESLLIKRIRSAKFKPKAAIARSSLANAVNSCFVVTVYPLETRFLIQNPQSSFRIREPGCQACLFKLAHHREGKGGGNNRGCFRAQDPRAQRNRLHAVRLGVGDLFLVKSRLPVR